MLVAVSSFTFVLQVQEVLSNLHIKKHRNEQVFLNIYNVSPHIHISIRLSNFERSFISYPDHSHHKVINDRPKYIIRFYNFFAFATESWLWPLTFHRCCQLQHKIHHLYWYFANTKIDLTEWLMNFLVSKTNIRVRNLSSIFKQDYA